MQPPVADADADPDAEAVLATLDPEQRAVATALTGPVCVLAGAGTGKTRALTHRIAYGVRAGTYDPAEVLAVTFTTRAAAEMRTRLSRLGVRGVSTRTFHSAALAQVRYFWPRLYGTPFPAVLDDPALLLRDLVGDAPVGERDLATEISWAKVSNVGPEQYVEVAGAEGRRVPGAAPSQVAALYDAYVHALARADRVDLDDVLLAAVGVVRTQPEVAAVLRRRFRWFVVDEFQDVSGVQLALLQEWLGDRDDVCVVGDPAQAIYAFAGARPDALARFPDLFPGARVLRLTRNYRSTPAILSVAAAVERSGGAPLVPTRRAGAPVRVREFATDHEEVAQVADEVARLVEQGTAEADVAVLVRTRAHVTALSRALRGCGIGVSARGGARFFERPEVRQALTLLAAASRRDEPGTVAERTAGLLGELGWQPQRPAAPREAARWESWTAIVDVARAVDAGTAGASAPSLPALVDELAEMARAGEEPRGVGVTVATLHATKGQEWRHVFVLGAHDGGIPSSGALSRVALPQAVAEEQRLLYVGLTRASDELTICWAARRVEQQARRRRPSRFLEPLLSGAHPDVLIRLHAEPPSG